MVGYIDSPTRIFKGYYEQQIIRKRMRSKVHVEGKGDGSQQLSTSTFLFKNNSHNNKLVDSLNLKFLLKSIN